MCARNDLLYILNDFQKTKKIIKWKNKIDKAEKEEGYQALLLNKGSSSGSWL